MSYSNADTRSRPADPYKEKILKKPSLRNKVEDLVAFTDKCKFYTMTTRMGRSYQTACLALHSPCREGNHRKAMVSTCSSTRLPSPAKLMTLPQIPTSTSRFLPSGEWAAIRGKSVETDRNIVKIFYSPALKAWIGDLGDGKHDGGPDDPRICVKAITAQYAISKRSVVGAFVELAKGVTTGEAPNVNRLRQLSEKELAQCVRLRGVSFKLCTKVNRRAGRKG